MLAKLDNYFNLLYEFEFFLIFSWKIGLICPSPCPPSSVARLLKIFSAPRHTVCQGRIQDFAQGGRDLKYLLTSCGVAFRTARSAVHFSHEARKFLGGPPPPHKHNKNYHLREDTHKKWSKPLSKKNSMI